MTKVGEKGDTSISLNMISSFAMQIETALGEIGYLKKPDKGGAAVLKAAGYYFTPTEINSTDSQWWIGVYYQSPAILCVWVDEKYWAVWGEDNPSAVEWRKDPEGGRFRDFPLDKQYFGKGVEGQITFIKECTKKAVSDMAPQ